jgi:hypothetical protein
MPLLRREVAIFALSLPDIKVQKRKEETEESQIA